MKRTLFAVFAVLNILSGCEYHPYYDGQKFCLYSSEYGLFETDGAHIYVPLYSEEAYVFECYGGKGQHHTVEIEDPDILGYSYIESAVDQRPFESPGIVPAGISLQPQKYGDTSMTIADEDTGESIMINVHICEAAKAIQVYEGCNTFETNTVLSFRYAAQDDIVHFCRGNVSRRELEYIAEGKYEFVDIDGLLHLQLTYPADEEGKLSASGKDTVKLYQIQYRDGYSYAPESMMVMLNMQAYPIQTRSAYNIVEPGNYHTRFRFVDVTDIDPSTLDHIDDDREIFYAYSAEMIPWILEQ